ncbi:hypothetical protein EAI_12594, partial [Harpegnathos saltator]
FIDDFTVSKPSNFYRDGIRQLLSKWRKVVDNNGEYF